MLMSSLFSLDVKSYTFAYPYAYAYAYTYVASENQALMYTAISSLHYSLKINTANGNKTCSFL